MESIIEKLTKEAINLGYTFSEDYSNKISWIKADLCFYLEGYKPNYDIRDDYGNKYSHERYEMVNNICTKVFGTPIEIHTPNMDKTRDSYWGTSYKRWRIDNIEIVNYMYGHPKSGFFNTCLYIHKGQLNCEIK